MSSRSSLRASVLMYHSVCTAAVSAGFERFQVAPSSLVEHLSYLSECGRPAVRASDLIDAAPDNSPVLLTFDDGYRDFAETVLPLLARSGLPATLYVPTDFVGGTARWLARDGEGLRPILDWAQLREIRDSGLVEIGAHSHTHPQMDRVDRARARAEVSLPQRILEDELQIPVRTFAYPFGYHDRRSRLLVADQYDAAFAVADRHAAHHDDVYAIPRITVNADVTAAQLAWLLGRESTRLERSYSEAKRLLWQGIRRTGGREPSAATSAKTVVPEK